MAVLRPRRPRPFPPGLRGSTGYGPGVTAPTAGLFEELSWRGLVYQTTGDALGRLLGSKPVTAYHGIDLTADSLHVGHLVGVTALRRLQLARHRPIALLGGATSLIGDPSGKTSERPLLEPDEIRANAEGIRAQLSRFVELGPSGALLVNNLDWFAEVRLTEFLRHVGKRFTVNAMIAKESVRARLEEREQGISYTEFSYMLLQAYDFLHLHDTFGCGLQMGGSDQWGNITAGVDLVRRARGADVHGLTWPLLTKADGTKFGKSEAGNVWLDPARTSPYAFFQFWVRTDDRDVGRLLRMLSFRPREEIEALEAAAAAHPERRQAQQALAEEMTATVHGPEEAERARGAAEALFRGDLAALDERSLLAALGEAPTTEVSRGELEAGLPLVDLLARTGLTASKSAARAALRQGGISVNGRREPDVDRLLGPDDLVHGAYLVLRRGRRDYHLLRFT